MVRQALAGMLWSKQYFGYDVERWLTEHGRDPLDAPARSATATGSTWSATTSSRCRTRGSTRGSPPGTWPSTRSPSAWSTSTFAKGQLDLLLSRRYLHPNGQIPAYEWNFSDVNPPVHAWATYLLYELEKARTGQRRPRPGWRTSFHKLAKNFTWWVNRKDADGRNVFQGGFLGPGQHRRLRPQRAAAHRRPPRPGRRHRLDGAVLPEHAADRAGAGRATTRSTSSRRRPSSSTSPGSRSR